MIIMIEVFPVAPISMIRNMAEIQKVKNNITSTLQLLVSQLVGRGLVSTGAMIWVV